MGTELSKPVTDKHSFTHVYNVRPDDDYALEVGGSAMQGWRPQMEDAHSVVFDVDPDCAGKAKWSWFGVFDGHCGRTTADFAGENLWQVLVSRPEWKLGQITSALREAFLHTDLILRSDPGITHEGSGSTAVACLIGRDSAGVHKVYCANVGDSRAVLSRAGETVPLSFDHKPDLDTERTRILAAGSFVSMNRVNGNLALSRALGDFEFKTNTALLPEQQAVSPEPDIIEKELTPADEFIVIACDGIWDVMSSEEVVAEVRAKLLAGESPTAISEATIDRCLSANAMSVGCDNMTMMIIDLRGVMRVRRGRV